MRARLLVVVAALGALLAVSLPARPAVAQLTKDQIAKAKKHYADAEKAMKAGDYDIAAREYGIAYSVTKDPVLFYNMAQAYELANNCQMALVYYGRYLKEGNPSEKNKQLAEANIAKCQKRTAKPGDAKPGDAKPGDAKPGDAKPAGTDTSKPKGTTDMAPDFGASKGDDAITSTPPPKGERPPAFTDEKPSWKRTAAWVSVGVAMAFATTGAVLGLSASSREEDVQNLINFRETNGLPKPFDGTTRERYEDLIDEGKRLNGFSRVAFVVAGAGAAAAITFFILDRGGKKPGATASSRTRLVPIVSADGLGLGATLEF